MSQNKSNKVTYNQHKFSPQLKKISWDYPYSDANHFTVVSNTNKLMLWKNHAKSLKNDFYFIHRYRAYFGGLFSFRVLNKRTGRYTNFASGFSFFNPKSERGWAYISKGRVLWPAEKIVENIIKKKLLCFHKTNDGRFLASALMTSNKLPALPQRRNFSWHYRMHMRNHLHSHFNRAFRLFAPQVNATGLDAVASGVAAANEFYRGKLFSIIPSVRAAQLTNYMFMKAERSKMLYDTRYMFPETPALAIRSTLGLGFRSEIARAFDSFSGDRSPMRYGWSSFSFRPFNTSGATRVEEITKEFNRGIGNIKPLSYKSAFYMLKHLKVRARASTEP